MEMSWEFFSTRSHISYTSYTIHGACGLPNLPKTASHNRFGGVRRYLKAEGYCSTRTPSNLVTISNWEIHAIDFQNIYDVILPIFSTSSNLVGLHSFQSPRFIQSGIFV